MEINKDDIECFIQCNSELSLDEILKNLDNIYDVNISDNIKRYTVHTIAKNVYEHVQELKIIYEKRKRKLIELKKLKLPDQRSPEWYEMRKKRLTASSLASAIGKDHFTSRDELILSKLEPKPYESNPITEWGVKYEDVAIMFYEELYNVKVLDFGLVPHPEFDAFGASPDGICDDTGNLEYIGRMVEIKCPPKRKFTATVPPHYKMQVLGQLEVCDLDECDFFQVKIEEYDNYEDYCKDIFIIDDSIVVGRTNLNYPKGVTITYKIDDKLIYKYCRLNQTNEELLKWIEENKTETIHEVKWWKITRYECTLVKRDNDWWVEIVGSILKFYNDLLYYKNDENRKELKEKVEKSKKRYRKNKPVEPLQDYLLISEDEDN
tara:strand:- start:783 stop:1916 length:1134 start_codon:yes stop_codon:yes gene_type:complete